MFSEADMQAYVAAVQSETAVIRHVTQATGPAVQQSRALAVMRSLVSQEKVRFQEDGFDLDLTYITPNIIAMGFPSAGKEAYFRNPIEEVERFFLSRHAGHFRIYNLCSERDYDRPTRFGGAFRRFPFDDHNAPCPIRLIPELVRDATMFLQEDARNVVAIHCKAGKGRTGVMVSCLLRAVDPTNIRSAQEALTHFGNVRTNDGKGVTIPSQMRYVRYWDQLMAEHQAREPPPRTVKLQQLRVESAVKKAGSATVDLYFTVDQMGQQCYDSRQQFRSGGKREKDGGFLFVFDESHPPVALTGDVRFNFYHRNSLLADEDLFHFWLNTSLCQARERLAKKDGALDGRPAKGKDDTFHQDLAVDLVLLGGSSAAVQGAAAAGAVLQQGSAAAAGGQVSSGGHQQARSRAESSRFTAAAAPKSGGFFSKVFK
jgi:phosphatidylinositol-3,4,5-trisphosphate 3-phosphatase/dual-specificity protein phosphatase PTEN